MYNSYFDGKIRDRGFQYYKSGKVTNIVVDKNKVSAMVTGNNLYNVEVIFNENDDSIIESAKCNCKYFTDKNNYCKHIYATVMSVKYSEEKEKKEIEENEKDILQVKNECKKYIKMCQNIFNEIRGRLVFDRKYLTQSKFEHYEKYYKTYLKSFNTDIELVRKKSIYISFYKARLESLKRLYEIITEDLNSLIKDIQKGKSEVDRIETHSKKGKSFSILRSLFGLVGALMPEEEKGTEGLKVGDWVEETPYGADGEILDIYKEDGKYKYDVLIESDHESDGDFEDEDVFDRD